MVQVKIVNSSGDIISNRVPFTYTDENATKKHDVREEMKNMNEAELQELLIATAKRFGEMNLKSKEETSRYDNPGKFHLLVDLIAEPVLSQFSSCYPNCIERITLFLFLFIISRDCRRRF